MQIEGSAAKDAPRSPLLPCAVIVSVALVIAAALLAFASMNLTSRPISGSFSGSLVSSDGGYYGDLMSIYQLKEYLMLYPQGEATYENEEQGIIEKLEGDIRSNRYPSFPYVQIDGTMYFNKQAVDEWFYERAREQLRVE